EEGDRLHHLDVAHDGAGDDGGVEPRAAEGPVEGQHDGQIKDHEAEPEELVGHTHPPFLDGSPPVTPGPRAAGAVARLGGLLSRSRRPPPYCPARGWKAGPVTSGIPARNSG